MADDDKRVDITPDQAGEMLGGSLLTTLMEARRQSLRELLSDAARDPTFWKASRTGPWPPPIRRASWAEVEAALRQLPTVEQAIETNLLLFYVALSTDWDARVTVFTCDPIEDVLALRGFMNFASEELGATREVVFIAIDLERGPTIFTLQSYERAMEGLAEGRVGAEGYLPIYSVALMPNGATGEA
jgi:hypothetical protein